jgi:hypothetical protein
MVIHAYMDIPFGEAEENLADTTEWHEEDHQRVGR